MVSSELQQYIDPGVNGNYLDTLVIYTIPPYGVGGAVPASVTHPDGSTTTYAYPDPFTTIETDPDNTQTTTVVDYLGNPLSSVKVDLGTGVTLSQQICSYTNASGTYFDLLEHGHNISDLAGRVSQYRYIDCCGEYSLTDPDGNETQFTDDLLKRPVASTVYYGGSTGITTTNTLDGIGHILMTQRIGTDGSPDTLCQVQYDLLGNVISRTNALGGVTTTTNVVINGQLYVTNTYPDGGTRIETYYSDGRLESVSGTAVHPVQYIYNVEQDTDGTWREYTQEIKLTPSGGTNEWSKTYQDGVGHVYKTICSWRAALIHTEKHYTMNTANLGNKSIPTA